MSHLKVIESQINKIQQVASVLSSQHLFLEADILFETANDLLEKLSQERLATPIDTPDRDNVIYINMQQDGKFSIQSFLEKRK